MNFLNDFFSLVYFVLEQLVSNDLFFAVCWVMIAVMIALILWIVWKGVMRWSSS